MSDTNKDRRNQGLAAQLKRTEAAVTRLTAKVATLQAHRASLLALTRAAIADLRWAQGYLARFSHLNVAHEDGSERLRKAADDTQHVVDKITGEL